MGKHSKPPKHTMRNSLLISATAATALTAAPATAQAQPPQGWDAVIKCESGGRNIKTQIPGPYTASGYFQITNGTWKANGGTQFSQRAMDATYEQQLSIANNIYNRAGSLRDWNASKSCWQGSSAKVNIQKAEPTQPTQRKAKAKAKAKAKVVKEKHVHPHVHAEPALTVTVKRGDTLSEIALANGMTWRKLHSLNKQLVKNPDLILVGWTLKV